MGKALIPKEEKVVDYHEVHVIGSVLTKPNSINGLPPFTLKRNHVVTVNPPKKTKEFFFGCNPKKRGKIVSRDKQTWGYRKSKGIKDPLNFKYKRGRYHQPKGVSNTKEKKK